MPQVDRTHLLCLLVFTVCLILTSGYVLDNHSRRNSRIRGREGSTTPAAPSAPVKTNEEQDVDGVGGNPRDPDRDRDVQKNEFSTDTSLEGETHHGQGSLSRWFNQLFPSSEGYHGLVQLGPGLSFNVSSGINLGGASSQPWWLGPHVCVTNEKKEDDGDRSRTGSRIFHHSLMITYSCDENVSVRKCVTVKSSNGRTTTTTQTYECCRGFERGEDQRYCTEEQDRVDLVSTMEHLSATEMVRALAMSGLTNVIQASNYTIFTPTNQAFDRYYKPDPDMNVVVINEEMQSLASGLSAAMTSHIVPGFLLTSSMEDEQLIQTENPESKIRINKYMVTGREAQVITANCVPISRTNVKATNGIVHVVDSVLKPVSKDIKAIIRGDSRLKIMSSMLESITLEEGGHYTILAPTDQAFQKLKPAVRDRIMMGHTCGKDVIKQHILPNVICTTVIQGRVRTRNVLNQYVHMSRDHDQILVESSPVLQRDVMATNGVVHVIDSVILPSSAVDVMEAIEKSGATRFLELMRATNGEQQLNSLENYTLFVPSNEALEEAEHLNADRSHYNDEASKLLARHVISGVLRGRQLYHGRQLNSSNHRDVYTVQSYQGIPFSTRSVKSVQCSPIIQSDIDTCDAVIHVVSKLIVPPSGNVLDLLQKNSTFSELLQLIRSAQLIDLLSDNEHPFTLFAPTNQAFSQLPNEFMNELRNDPSKARRVILGHIIPDIRCCTGISNNDLFTSYVLNMDGWMINMDRSPRTDRVRYGSAHVVSCDHTATNGVIHAIDTFSPAVIHRYGPRPPRRRGHSGYRFSLDNLWSMFD